MAQDPWRKDEPTNKTWWWVGGGAIVLVLLVIFVIVPAYRGYRIYSALDGQVPDKYITDMAGLTQEKAAAEAAASQAQATLQQQGEELAASGEQLSACQKERDACAAELAKAKRLKDDVMKSLGDDATQAKEELQACQAKLENVDEQDAVIADAARRLCCMQRVENPSINSFSIADGKIACAKDGKTKISC